MTPDFLEREVLRPFSKADSFKPGSGLGLGLAQRMIELLGGKLAIASTPGKGTLVHVEVPLHLYNQDNDSDQDNMAAMKEGSTISGSADFDAVTEKVRQDGIYLMGFGPAAGGPSEARVNGAALKRVGKSLLRQLKLNFCRVVPEVQYASLIVVPEHVPEAKIVAMCARARPNVELVIIGERKKSWVRIRSSPKQGKLGGEPSRMPPMGRTESGFLVTHEEVEEDEVQGIKARRLYRPLRPSVLGEIMRPPPPTPNAEQETYISAVVGGPVEPTSEATEVDETWSRVREGQEQQNIGPTDNPDAGRDSGEGPPTRPSLRRTRSAVTARTSRTDVTEVSARTVRTSRTDSTTLPDEIRPSPAGSAVGSSSSILHDKDDEDDDAVPPHSSTPSSRRESASTGSTGNSPKMSELRELGPIPDSLRTIRAEFEDALPALDHRTRKREPVRPSLGERRHTDRRTGDSSQNLQSAQGVQSIQSGQSGQSRQSAGVLTPRASSGAVPQSSQAHTRSKSEIDGALTRSGSGSGGGASGTTPMGATSKEGKRRSQTGRNKDAAGEGDQVIGNKLRGEFLLNAGRGFLTSVLVVEDNDVNRRILVTMLRRSVSSLPYLITLEGD